MANESQSTSETGGPSSGRESSRPQGESAAKPRGITLWTYAKLLLVLGIMSLVLDIVGSVSGALFAFSVSKETGTDAAAGMMLKMLSFSMASAAFLTGSAVVAYLAARNDREAHGRADSGD